MGNEKPNTLSFWSGYNSRQIEQRIIVEGKLKLKTPAHFGNGDSSDLTDMPLLVDPLDGVTPLLTGASLAGALRSYLWYREKNYQQAYDQDEDWESLTEALFGGFKENDDGEQSSFIIEDAFGESFSLEFRDGVQLNPSTRTATDKALYNKQVWSAGTTFPLRFEVLITRPKHLDELQQELFQARVKKAFVVALQGFKDGEITLGGNKKRGLGQVEVENWLVRIYDLKKPQELYVWLNEGQKCLSSTDPKVETVSWDNLVTLLQVKIGELPDARQYFKLCAKFCLDGSLFIRSYVKPEIDAVYLQNNLGEPVVAGTSLAGALRARATKIVKTLGVNSQVVDELFGLDLNAQQNGKKTTPKASKLTVRERVVENGITDLVQNRVSIDRFTGGARDTALFDEQPVWGKPETVVTVDLHLVNPKDCEIGLLLLLLKDLWTGDLALGGESSIGRGRLKGQSATMVYKNSPVQTWEIVADGDNLRFGSETKPEELQKFVQSLNDYLNGGQA